MFRQLLRRGQGRHLAMFGTVLGIGAAGRYSMAESGGLDSKNFKSFKVKEIEQISHNTKVFKFNIPLQGEVPVASYVLAKVDGIGKEGKPAVRPYTPILQADGELTLLVKSYPTGCVSKHFGELNVGDEVQLKGPMKKIQWTENKCKNLVLLAGGTGITPMLQVAQKVLDNPNDKTQVTLIFANTTEQDILLRERLAKLAVDHPNFTVHHVVAEPSPTWCGLRGYVSADMVPAPTPDSFAMTCGPPGFMDAVSGNKTKDYKQGELTGILKNLGWTSEQVFKF